MSAFIAFSTFPNGVLRGTLHADMTVYHEDHAISLYCRSYDSYWQCTCRGRGGGILSWGISFLVHRVPTALYTGSPQRPTCNTMGFTRSPQRPTCNTMGFTGSPQRPTCNTMGFTRSPQRPTCNIMGFIGSMWRSCRCVVCFMVVLMAFMLTMGQQSLICHG